MGQRLLRQEYPQGTQLPVWQRMWWSTETRARRMSRRQHLYCLNALRGNSESEGLRTRYKVGMMTYRKDIWTLLCGCVPVADTGALREEGLREGWGWR